MQDNSPSMWPRGAVLIAKGGFVSVELLFLPSVYAPCPTCQGTRYNAKTLEITYLGKNIAEVLGLTVNAAWEFFAEDAGIKRSLSVLVKWV